MWTKSSPWLDSLPSESTRIQRLSLYDFLVLLLLLLVIIPPSSLWIITRGGWQAREQSHTGGVYHRRQHAAQRTSEVDSPYTSDTVQVYKSTNLKTLSLFFVPLTKWRVLLHFLTFLCGNKVTICFANSELFLKQNMLHDPPFSLEIHSLLPMTNISSGAPTKISLARRSQHESTPNTLSYWDLGLSSRNSSKP